MKKILGLFAFLITITASSQTSKYQLSGSVLDSATGKPSNGIRIKLDKYNATTDSWQYVSEIVTGNPERFLERKEGIDNRGIYKMTFYTYEHFKEKGFESIFPFIEINVNITTDEDYSFPVIATPFGYSTYRGNGYTEAKGKIKK